ncbi:MAG: hypothetical protein R6V19_07390, partial [Armatimonadota bacterium]
HSDGTDYIISRSVDETGTVELQLADGTLTCDGTVGFLRLRDGRVTAASLVGGTNLAYKDFALSSVYAGLTGAITGVEADEASGAYAFAVDQELPASENIAGHYVIVTHGDGSTHGYEVAGSARRGDMNLLQLADDPGFRISDGGDTEFLYFPHDAITGPNTYRISSVVNYEAEAH